MSCFNNLSVFPFHFFGQTPLATFLDHTEQTEPLLLQANGGKDCEDSANEERAVARMLLDVVCDM